ncbi:hypothetical protein PXO_06200 [Xanthomonas oryzae pv. oryzae PXO99A]|uniref:Uncharacterized protein n=1 Tax=Xanthomonas oryzae pv. oryzae (strain PXO99A) TaxID=360094 RepID=A0A0J9WX22_XANOP|nr:hypothetical protein PXO_00966 [Xanthomonas oryzae pv. oryzae PXO99A]ACD59388.1 hypothetical protein PXO_06200 [Xanthomonas oryzae pv. oryzae PXO99A]
MRRPPLALLKPHGRCSLPCIGACVPRKLRGVSRLQLAAPPIAGRIVTISGCQYVFL